MTHPYSLILAAVASALGLASACAAPLSAAPTTALTLFVSPTGHDAAVGDAAHPLATLVGVRDRLRQLRASDPRPVRVEIADGRYALTQPLQLEAQDGGCAAAPVIYAAAPGAHPVLSGGLPVTGWKVGADGVWETHAAPVCPVLWVDGQRATPARMPNAGFLQFKDVREEILEPKPANRSRARQTVKVTPDVFRELAALDPLALHAVDCVVYHKWDITRRRVLTLDAATESLVLEGEMMKPWNRWVAGTTYVLENLPGALDTPGEWYQSPTGHVRYWPRPGEQPHVGAATTACTAQLLVLKGQADRPLMDLRFEGIVFQEAQAPLPPAWCEPAQSASATGAVIEVDAARRVVFKDCTIAHTGSWGLWFHAGCQDCGIYRSDLRDLGAGAVRIGATDARAPISSKITVENNICAGGGRVNPSAAGVLLCHASDCVITHNEIHDFFYTGLSLGWVWGYAASPSKRNQVTYNHVHHIGQGRLSDLGGIYTLGSSEGTVVANNVFHDIESMGYGGWGLYTDEGSAGILFENNLVYNTKTGGFHQHYGRDNIVRNNIFAGGREQQLQVTRVEDHRSFTFEHNIVWWNSAAPALAGPWNKIHVDSTANCWWNAGGKVNFLGADLAVWQAAGHEQGSVVADPLFKGPAMADFRLQAGSPVFQFGFKAFDPAAAGVEGDAAWRSHARE